MHCPPSPTVSLQLAPSLIFTPISIHHPVTNIILITISIIIIIVAVIIIIVITTSKTKIKIKDNDKTRPATRCAQIIWTSPPAAALPLLLYHKLYRYDYNYDPYDQNWIHSLYYVQMHGVELPKWNGKLSNIFTSIISEYVTLRPQYIFYQCCITANRANRSIGLRDSTVRPQKVDSNCKFANNLYLIHNTVCSDLDLSHGNKEVSLALYFCLQINFLRK